MKILTNFGGKTLTVLYKKFFFSHFNGYVRTRVGVVLH